MNVRRRGFTLIEILITIGIILVLVSIVSVGITYVTRAGKSNSVKVTLNNLRGMIAELEVSAGLAGRQPPSWLVNGVRRNGPFPAGANVWKDDDPTTPGTIEPAFVPTGPVTPDLSQAGGPRYDSDAVVNTQFIMQLLVAVPKNKTVLGQFPAEQLMEKLPGTFDPEIDIRNNTTDRTPTTPLPLDTWGNPIIFVPAAGLCGNNSEAADDAMWIGGMQRTRSDGTVNPDVKFVSVQTGTNRVAPIRSPDGRPFWASAGPDGDFRTGDDNVYSFGN